jgi:hypothetical protein
MSTGLYRLLWRRFSRIGHSLGGPRAAGSSRHLKSALIALTVGTVLLAGAGAWLVLWVDDSESADGSFIRVTDDATNPLPPAQPASQNGASGQASADQMTANQTTGRAPSTTETVVQGPTVPEATPPAAIAGQNQANAVPEPSAAEDKPTASIEPPAVNGLRISSQSWRRGGLGSKALVTFTLRNDNPYAVKDLELACAFSRRDGSHLTDRTRIVPGPVGMRSRKTFRAVHVGFVNVNASKAKCTLAAASKN